VQVDPHGCYPLRARISGHFDAYTEYSMPNIRQQEKRVRQASRQRLENLRWRSTAKTLMRRLQDAAEKGDAASVTASHRELVSWLDKAAARGSLH
jgi:small subunit ribosomal protein S20